MKRNVCHHTVTHRTQLLIGGAVLVLSLLLLGSLHSRANANAVPAPLQQQTLAMVAEMPVSDQASGRALAGNSPQYLLKLNSTQLRIER